MVLHCLGQFPAPLLVSCHSLGCRTNHISQLSMSQKTMMTNTPSYINYLQAGKITTPAVLVCSLSGETEQFYAGYVGQIRQTDHCWLCWPTHWAGKLINLTLVMLAYSQIRETSMLVMLAYSLSGKTKQCLPTEWTGRVNSVAYFGLFTELGHTPSRLHQIGTHRTPEFWMCSASDTFTDFLNFF